jgi:hypothetical protein
MADNLIPVTTLIEPFDINLHLAGSGLASLQQRFMMWLRGVSYPFRFVTWQVPADLSRRIDYVATQAALATDPQRRALLMEYRRFYEELQREGRYQRSICGMCQWVDPGENAQTIARAQTGTFDTFAYAADWPPLFDGNYELCPPNRRFRHWYLRPVGKPGGRYFFHFLVSYELLPSMWNFFSPLANTLHENCRLALAVDVPKTYTRNQAISNIETVLMAYNVHLRTTSSTNIDSRSVKKVEDCHLTLRQLNEGDSLHEVQVALAVAAPTLEELDRHVTSITENMRGWIQLRPELGLAQVQAARFFAPVLSKHILVPQRTWQVVSRELSLFFGPLGQRKLAGTAGVMRGESARGNYPYFHDSWTAEKKATHELWVGMTGSGKTFALNLLLMREYIEQGVTFDLLEPMGHGKTLADALNLPWYVLSSRVTCLNPLDIMYPRLIEQVTHVIRIIETLLGRRFAGNQKGNQEKALLGQAVEVVYRKFGGVEHINADNAPIMSDLCAMLTELGQKRNIRQIARDLADEVAGLCVGNGPYAAFINGRTNMDLSFRGRARPRIFSFHEMESDPELLAVAYTQVLTAIRRDSLIDETPRIIAVDEVYRLMRHPSLLDFLIEAAKTFRTRRKKLIVIDQQMKIFLNNDKARLIMENCPIRVIFNQKMGLDAFDDPAFDHIHDQYRKVIGQLKRGYHILDIQDQGISFLYVRPSTMEFERFSST